MHTTSKIAAEAATLPDAPTLAMTVNDALARWPYAVRALNAFGIDTCCGGGATLEQAARDAGMAPQALLDAIASSEPGNRSTEVGA